MACRKAYSVWGHFIGRIMITPDVKYKWRPHFPEKSLVQQAVQHATLMLGPVAPGASLVHQSPAVSLVPCDHLSSGTNPRDNRRVPL